MNKDLESKRDELAKEYRHFVADSYAEYHYKVGYNAAEPIIRADERARIFGLLRSKEYEGSYTQQMFYSEAANYLENKLKEENRE